MADRKYYYMRLKEDFFDSDEMILLEAMPDGIIFQNILLKMYCRSLKNEGRLMLNGVIPFNSQMLASVTRQQIGTVEKALDVFQQLGLIEILDNGAIYMSDIQKYIGSSSTEADRKRDYRVRIDTEKEKCLPNGTNVRTNVGQMSGQMSDRDRDITIDKDIYRDKDKEREINKEKEKTKRERFVPPSLDDVKAYCKETGKPIDAEAFIDYYTANGWRTGKNPMKEWKAAVRQWRRRDEESGKVYKEPNHDYDFWGT